MGTARELSALGNNVTYVASESMSKDRLQQGWLVPDSKGLRVEFVTNARHAVQLVESFPADAIHITQGISRNGYISSVIRRLSLSRARWGAMTETIDERYGVGPIKRLIYKSKLSRGSVRPEFVLAIGAKMPSWVAARGFPERRIFPFTYFLPRLSESSNLNHARSTRVRVGFVGHLTRRKRVDLLIEALTALSRLDFELVIIGDGPLKSKLQLLANVRIGKEKVKMLGTLPMDEIPIRMGSLDTLVLPSDFDGWGVAVTEALMAGVPCICSDACGVSEVVYASGVGGVFPKGDVKALGGFLEKMISKGRVYADERRQLVDWSNCLSAEVGAKYLMSIVASIYYGGHRPSVPWDKGE